MDTEYAAAAPHVFALTDVRRVGRSLLRQSVLVAVVSLALDCTGFILNVHGAITPPRLVVLLAIIAVDSALAMPARWSGWVALAHAAVNAAFSVATPFGPGWKSLNGTLVAGYRAGAWLRGWSGFAALAVLAGSGARRWLAGVEGGWFVLLLGVSGNAVLPWLVGRYTTARRAYIDELRHRRENELRDAAAEVEKAVARERTAIARDLHDVISHHVSAIGVHAGAARMKLRAAGADEHGVADSLAAVETSSRLAIGDLRALLDLWHGTSDTARQPGLDNLEELFDGVRRSGLVTRLRVHGVPRPVPGSLDIALYRITQEMLTNALRHGDGSPVDVDLAYGDESITLAARNGMAWAPAEPSGTARGLAGIRTRAALFHGNVRYGPERDDGRWATIVTVPIAEAS